jgi:hypothetical protein
MNPDEIRKYDESSTLITDTIPPMLWNFFTKCKDEGFASSEALTLTAQFLNSMIMLNKGSVN